MKENKRKCLKCGRSPADDPAVRLFRFPQPGLRNMLRCESWAKYCFPDKQCSIEFQSQLFKEHRMLCDKHFAISSFLDFESKKLHRFAVPEDSIRKVIINVQPSMTMPNNSRAALGDISNPFVQSETVQSSLEPQPGPSGLQQKKQETMEATNINLPLELSTSTQHTMEPQPGPSGLQQMRRGQDDKKDLIYDDKSSKKQKLLLLKCRKAMKKICQLRKRLNKLKNKTILKELETDENLNILLKKITPTLALLLQGEIKNFKRKPMGRRWTKEQKIIALRLYKRSPTGYRLLRRLFCLLAESTLKILLSKIPLSVGINRKLFNVLKIFSQDISPSENEFILMFDEMSIRKHLHYNKKEDKIEGYQDHANQGRCPLVASYALVFMICGITMTLKQPIAYYFSSSSVTADRLAVLIKEVLRSCFEANINVAATVCDMDGVNRRALGILGANVQNPCFKFNNRTIVSFFDAPHLLKCFRNLFLKYDIEINHTIDISSEGKAGKGIAKWSHIQRFNELDNLNPNFVLAPNLKQEHLNPNSKQKMRVKLAAQVFSRSVAIGMFYKVAQGQLPAEATITANLLGNMDNLFDCLNSSTPDWRRGKRHSTNMTDQTPHLQLFKEMKRFFETCVFIGCRTTPASINGWIWTLTAIEMFWKGLIRRHPIVKSLATRRLQQDPLENLFGCIRGHCGSNTNPTTGQFTAGLKTALLSSLANVGAGGNCERDENNTIFDNMKILTSTQSTTNQLSPGDFSDNQLGGLSENISFDFEKDLGEINAEIEACAYVCGFIMKNYKNNCDLCNENLIAKVIDLEHIFVDMKEYSETKRALNYVTKGLIKYVEDCATGINKYLEINSHKNNLKENIIDALVCSVNADFLKCNVHKESNIKFLIISTFYICIKRFCLLKNRQFTEEASANALRKKIVILKHI